MYPTYPPHRSCMRRELCAYLSPTHRAPTGAQCMSRELFAYEHRGHAKLLFLKRLPLFDAIMFCNNEAIIVIIPKIIQV